MPVSNAFSMTTQSRAIMAVAAVCWLSACASISRDMDSVYWDVAAESNIYIHNVTPVRRDFYAVLAWLEDAETGDVVFALEPNEQDLQSLLNMSFRTPPGRYRGVYACDITRLQRFDEITGIAHNKALSGIDHWGEERTNVGHVFDQTIPGGVQLGARNIRPRAGNLICTPLIADGRRNVSPATRRADEAVARAESRDRFYLDWLE